MIEIIQWSDILPIWQQELWPERKSPIQPVSAMCLGRTYDMNNMLTTPTFFGFVKNDRILGVNSGHSCPGSNSYRSRGLWVNPRYRGQGIGQSLLQAAIEQGRKEGRTTVWSYPRKSSWPTYAAVGFKLESDWGPSETSDQNAYCAIRQK
jgi:GNAT superfamily N-acetyltransferase